MKVTTKSRFFPHPARCLGFTC